MSEQTEQQTQHNDLARLLGIMAQLRNPTSGCPWDLAQTFLSIVPHTLEEAYEVADAIERQDYHSLREELGDLLLQVVFYSRLAEEQRLFDFHDVAAGISDKLVRRHPHVFGDAVYATEQERAHAWEAEKARERQEKRAASATESALDGIALALPALTRALKLQQRAAKVGFDWPAVEAVRSKVSEELAEVEAELEAGGYSRERLTDEIGDLLFSAVNLSRHLQVDPETALRTANRKFEQRFRYIETTLAGRGARPEDCDLDELDRLWLQAKQQLAE